MNKTDWKYVWRAYRKGGHYLARSIFGKDLANVALEAMIARNTPDKLITFSNERKRADFSARDYLRCLRLMSF